MEIKNGDKVRYKFPEPKAGGLKEFTGHIELITEDYIIMQSDLNIKLKVSFQNFEYITPLNKNSKDPLSGTTN